MLFQVSRRSFVASTLVPLFARIGLGDWFEILPRAEFEPFTLAEATEWPPVDRQTTPAQTWTSGAVRLVVRSFGTQPSPLGERWFRGSGVTFTVEGPGHEPISLLGNSEADIDLHYTVDGGELVAVQRTYDPEVNAIVPFVEHRFPLFDGAGEHRRQLLLSPTTPISALPEYEAVLSRGHHSPDGTSPSATYDELSQAMSFIRNIGVRDPAAVKAALARHRGDPWTRGHLGCELHETLRDLDVIESTLDASKTLA